MALKVWGFPEYTPAQQAMFDDIKNIIETTYQSFGYVHIETPAVERNEVLFKGWEWASKEIFWLYGMASGADDLKWYGLNFDLTIPFARYVLDNQWVLTFPFKRYQTQWCRRGERPQRGRFRQFMQADIDAIWRQDADEVKYLFYDAELIYLLRLTLEHIRKQYLKDKKIVTHVNNRNILWGLFTALVGDDQEKKAQLSKLFDSYYKMSESEFYDAVGKVLEGDAFEKIKIFVWLSIDELTPDFVENDEFARGVEQMQEVFRYIRELYQWEDGWFVYDPFIVRGLDYYTGTVFENLIEGDVELGSICSGWRYANLTQSIDAKSARFDGVGGSIGISRLFTLILEEQEKTWEESMLTSRVDYLIMHFSETFDRMIALADELRGLGQIVELYPAPDKLKKQFSYADKLGVEKVIVCGEEEMNNGVYMVKYMESGEEAEIKFE